MTKASDFLLISDLEILDIKNRLHIYPLNQIFAQLQLNCRTIKELGVENIILKPPSNSLFVIYNVIQELGLAYKLAEDIEAGNLAKNLINKVVLNPLQYPKILKTKLQYQSPSRVRPLSVIPSTKKPSMRWVAVSNHCCASGREFLRLVAAIAKPQKPIIVWFHRLSFRCPHCRK